MMRNSEVNLPVLARVGRWNYFKGLLACSAASIVAIGFFVIGRGLVRLVWNLAGRQTVGILASLDGLIDHSLPLLVMAALLIPLLYFQTLLSARRCHDLGLSSGFVVLLFLPFIGVFFLIFLLLKKGDSDVNRYGAPPS
jgi:uncharacterized membrane protein YhaH (DUF805 family)